MKKVGGRPGRGARATGGVPGAAGAPRPVRSREAGGLLGAAFEASAAALALLGGDPPRALRVNRAFRELLPDPAADPVGRTLAEVSLPGVAAAARRVLATGEPVHLAHHAIPAPGGRQRRLAVHLRRIGPRAEHAVLVVAWETTDLEAARRHAEDAAERALRHTAELDAVLDSMVDGLVLFGPRGEVVRMNAAATRLMPMSEADRALPMAERDPVPTFAPDGRLLRREELPQERALGGTSVRGVRIRLAHPELGSVFVAVSAAPIRGPGGIVGGAVMTISDESDVHALEQERDDLLRMISHDLRTPLNAVATAAHLIRRDPGDAAKVEDRAAAIARSCDRMSAMIQDLVETTLLEAGQLRLAVAPVDLAAAIPELLDRLRGGLAVDRVRLAFAPALPRVLADPARLERVLVNLLSNALKYSPPESEVVLGAAPAPEGVAIAVTDRGVGIAPEDQAHIFDRFFRARGARRPEGLGLGLYIARLLVEAHGGTVSAESGLGQGSTFRVVLPAAP